MDGYNVCIFAYGQTGSGKTHTMVRFLSHLDSAAQSYVYFLDLLHELNVVYCQTMLSKNGAGTKWTLNTNINK